MLYNAHSEAVRYAVLRRCEHPAFSTFLILHVRAMRTLSPSSGPSFQGDGDDGLQGRRARRIQFLSWVPPELILATHQRDRTALGARVPIRAPDKGSSRMGVRVGLVKCPSVIGETSKQLVLKPASSVEQIGVCTRGPRENWKTRASGRPKKLGTARNKDKKMHRERGAPRMAQSLHKAPRNPHGRPVDQTTRGRALEGAL